jgi:hypothetical protein
MGDNSVLSWIAGDTRTKAKALKTAGKLGGKVFPIARTVQAADGFSKVGEVIDRANKVANNIHDLLPQVHKLADRINQFVPSIQVMGRSFCDSVKIISYFNVSATSVGIAANVVLTYQGVQALELIAAKLQDISVSLAAQTALRAQQVFPEYVYEMVRERLDQTSDDRARDHWFFVYHPDNDWYPKFYHCLEKKPLGPSFCGYTNQIDTAFVFMLAARQRIQEKAEKARKQGRTARPVKLHLLIPAYQPILIAEALRIPEEIGDFVMEGRINSNKEFVWLNLPQEQRHYVVDIGHWVPPEQGFWDWAMTTIGLADALPALGEPRVLGTRQQAPHLAIEQDNEFHADDSDTLVGSRGTMSDDGHGGDKKRNRHHATPLHHRRSLDHETRHRR